MWEPESTISNPVSLYIQLMSINFAKRPLFHEHKCVLAFIGHLSNSALSHCPRIAAVKQLTRQYWIGTLPENLVLLKHECRNQCDAGPYSIMEDLQSNWGVFRAILSFSKREVLLEWKLSLSLNYLASYSFVYDLVLLKLNFW